MTTDTVDTSVCYYLENCAPNKAKKCVRLQERYYFVHICFFFKFFVAKQNSPECII